MSDDLPRWSFPSWPSAVPASDRAAAVRAFEARHARLTKPTGSLGVLEVIGARLAGLQLAEIPASRPAACLLFVSDHPVAARGVSAYPREVTRAMVANFAAGGAAASVLCRRLGLDLHIVDVGVAGGPVSVTPAAGARYRRMGCADLPVGDLVDTDAMTPTTYRAALTAGARAIDVLGDDVKVIAIGEMGIGNTTCAAAVAAAILGASARELVGPGTGVAGDALARKVAVVDAALARVRGLSRSGATPVDGHRALQTLGGRELAAMVGAMAHGIERGMAVLVDGFIAGAAALALIAIDPGAAPGLIFGHRSREPGHRRVLDALARNPAVKAAGADALWGRPLVELDLALGEASGALIALPIVDAACALHAEMATFDGAGVPDRK